MDFTQGDLVISGSPRSALERGVVHRVASFIPPLPDEAHCGTVFLEGLRWGYSAEYVRLATDEEIQAWEDN